MFTVTGQSYQEKLAARHCVAGMEARLEPEVQGPSGAEAIVVKAYFRFRQRWETIGRIADSHRDSLSQAMAGPGTLAVTISRVTPRRDGYSEVMIELKQNPVAFPAQKLGQLGAAGPA
ncbi:MAG: hypothetical protein ACO3Q7_06875 [Steroidobacteraceae bacterium]